MKKISLFVFLIFFLFSSLQAQIAEYQQKWSADLGDGTFVNPIVNADFPDIDIIRVEDTYYMATTTMYYFPGATILKSKDLVNWEYCANPLEQILDNDAYNLLNGEHHYSQGMWASTLQYYNGKFYYYFPCSTWSRDSQSILLTATDPEGEWSVTRLSEAYHDPGWLFDNDGSLYVACGIGDIYVNKLNSRTFQKISSSKVLSVGNGCEGSHMYHIGDYYYIYATYGGTERSQTIFRSRNPFGPYEEHQGRVFANQNIHQGGLVQTQTGEWWTIMFRDIYGTGGSVGRIPCLEPVQWVDGWPVIGNNGVDVSKNGTPYKKPDVGATYEKKYLPTNDAFTDTKLGMQWQWNHNPDNSAWSLTERPGFMRLYTVNVTDELNWARNSLSQRILDFSSNGTASNNYKNSYGTVKLDLSGMQEGDVAGIAVFQNPYSFIAVKMQNGKKRLYSERCSFNSQALKKEELKWGTVISSDVIYLRAVVNFGNNSCKYYYSYNNQSWNLWGVTMNMGYTLDYFVGQRFFLFNYATKQLGGYVDIDWFTTEQQVFSEEKFGIEDPMAAYSDEDKIVASLTVEQENMALLAGGLQQLKVTMTAQSGVQRDVTSACTYTYSEPDMVKMMGSRIQALKEGETDVTATYTDEFENTQSTTFHITASYFPLVENLFNPSIVATGSFQPKFGGVSTGQNGLAGWQYVSGIDLSAYNYLVIQMRRKPTTSPALLIYDENNFQSTPCSYPLDIKQLNNNKWVINLQDLKKGDDQQLNLSHIYTVGFQIPAGATIYVTDVFLSDDGEHSTDIQSLPFISTDTHELYFDLQGRPVKNPAHGIYIHEGKQVYVP